MECILNCLDLFCKTSGQKVNFAKSSIFFSRNVDQHTRRMLSQQSGFKNSTELTRYLGAPIFNDRKKTQHFHYILERLQLKLASWKVQTLSLAGRITLAKSVISAMPIYPMQVTKIPFSICQEIERIQRRFIWGSNESHRKVHLVKWDRLCYPKKYGGLGFRHMSEMNNACLAKLTWGLTKGVKGLWADVLRNKYMLPRSAIDRFTKRNGDSHVWQAICNQVEIIELGSLWRVRNGELIRFFQDPWVEKGFKLVDVCIDEVNDEVFDSKVADWVTPYGDWDFHRMVSLLPQEVIDRIRCILPPNPILEDDLLVWGASCDGKFSVSSAYEMVNNVESMNPELCWNQIWNWKGAERIKVFIWIASQERLLTNSRISSWNASSPYCQWCQGVVESNLHVLRDCKFALNVWRRLVKPALFLNFFTCDMKQWCSLNLNKNLGVDRAKPWSLTWGFGVWMLWKWRNKATFDSSFKRPRDPVTVILKNRERFTKSSENKLCRSVPKVSFSSLGWQKPKQGWFKVNTDGARSMEGLASCGGTIRDDQGNWIVGFSMFLGPCSVLEAEEWGMLKGISLAWSLGLPKVEIESDAMMVVDKLLDAKLSDSENSILLSIREFLRRNWSTSIRHINR